MYYSIPLQERTKIKAPLPNTESIVDRMKPYSDLYIYNLHRIKQLIKMETKTNRPVMYDEQDLVSFGNYVLYRYRTQAEEDDNFIEHVHGAVQDADLANWRFLNSKNESTVQEAVSGNDGEVYGVGFTYTNISGEEV